MHMKLTIALACLTAAWPALAAPQPLVSTVPPSGCQLVARDDCGAGAKDPHRVQGWDYRYPESDVPPGAVPPEDPARTVSFDASQVVYRYTHLDTGARYKLRVLYLTEPRGPRTQTLYAGDIQIHGNLDLPGSRAEWYEFGLPPETYKDGTLELGFRHTSGPNAVVSAIELWSTGGKLGNLIVRAALEPQCRLEGSVVDDLAEPAAGASVRITAGGGEEVDATADASGAFKAAILTNWNGLVKSVSVTAQAGAATGSAAVPIASVFLVEPRLTPRPVWTAGVKTPVVDLNGIWKFNRAPPADFWKTGAALGNWSDIRVPGEWVMQGFDVAPNTAAGYFRSFTVPADWSGKRIKLRCDSVYSDAAVWVNGREAGSHLGGFTPFELDVTDLVQPGKANFSALAVKSESLADTLSSGSAYAAHPLGGITRKIHLFAAPQANIASLHVSTTFDAAYRDAALCVSLEIANEGTNDLADAEVRLALRGPGGRPIKLKPNRVGLPGAKAGRSASLAIAIPVAAPRKWDAEHPNLYTLTCTLQVRGKAVETVSRRFGFRQVEVRGNRVLVNGRPIKLRGVCRHEVHPLLGRSLSPELWRKDAELFRAANCNFIRTSHYPPAEEFIDACDEVGLYVEEEAPFCWTGGGSNPEVESYIAAAALEMVQRDRSHPSVIQWSLANESDAGNSGFAVSARQTKKLDPTRPVGFENGGWGGGGTLPLDFEAIHYPRPGDLVSHANDPRPILFGEYCHLNCYNRRELITDPGLRDYYGRGIEQMWDKVYKGRAFEGGSIWAALDDIFLLPHGMKTMYIGYGEWGPLDAWRREKPEYWHVKKAYSPIRIRQDRVNLPTSGGLLRIEVENRYDYTNLAEVRAEWSLGAESGKLKLDVPPRSKGAISILPKTKEIEGRELVLKFYDRRGFLIDAYKLPVGKVSEPALDPSDGQGELDLVESDAAITVRGRSFQWVFDRKTGLIREARQGASQVVIGGPYLMISPLSGGGGQISEDPLPLNDTCSGWRAASVSARKEGTSAVVEIAGRYDNSVGSFTYRVGPSGSVLLDYSFEMQSEADPREVGVALVVPRTLDTLAWNRKAQWNYYPDDHIGRPVGKAKAFRGQEWPRSSPRAQPKWPWALDNTPAGTNDFRSTKHNIWRASLTATAGRGLLVLSDSHQSARAWVAGNRICLLVACHSNDGSDSFYNIGVNPTRMPLANRSVVKDTVRLRLVAPLER